MSRDQISSPSVLLEAELPSTHGAIDRCLADLGEGRRHLPRASIAELVDLAENCIKRTVSRAGDWVEAACRAKGIAAGSPCRAEEIAAGPVTTIRALRLIIGSLRDIARDRPPVLPGVVRSDADGRLRVPVFPARGLFDPIVFAGFRAVCRMLPGVTAESMREPAAGFPGRWTDSIAKIALVLGAGNVSSIAATDVFTKVFQEGRVVLLKMNPVNDYLGPIFEDVFSSLIDSGFLRIVYGGGDVGQMAIQHELVDEVHITGSIATHDAIVLGPPGADRERRRRENTPLLRKPITSELGNVSPWIVVPGRYSRRQLRFQAENVVSSITNNASFNCLATKVVVTHRDWPQRDEFLQQIEAVLKQTPPRKAYYPGAGARYRSFTGRSLPEGENEVPWTLLRDVDPAASPRFFCEESFVCVAVETGLDAENAERFLEQAVEFANESLWGTLCAAITVPPDFRRDAARERLLQSCLGRLNYGSIGINHWPGLIYAMMTPPWGGAPGGTLADPQSGLGWVHNTYMLEGVEKTILEGPLTISPKPFWFPTHSNPEPMAWRLLQLYEKPSVGRLVKLLSSAITAPFSRRK